MSIWQVLPRPIPEGDPTRLARGIIRSLTDKQRGEILLELLSNYIVQEQRAEVKRVERRASHDDRRWWRNRRKEIDRLRIEAPDEYERQYTISGVIRTFEEEIRKELRLEVTAELLATSFALGDGRMVTWGEATIDDHTARLRVLGGNVLGNLETMALHEQAIDLLRDRHVARLAEITTAQAVAA